jgi:pimeloyl-ACP methyl ester carboxylesterase
LADDWDAQMLYFLGKGFCVIAHDRRGHGRSTQTGGGHDRDHYADDDQIVPYADPAPLSAKLLKNGTLKTYKGFPHGLPTTEVDTINADLLAFIKS